MAAKIPLTFRIYRGDDLLREEEFKQEVINVRISAFGRLKGDISTLQGVAQQLADADSFDTFEITSSNEAVLSASVDGGATPATYSVDVTQLAQARLAGIIPPSPKEGPRRGIGSGDLRDRHGDCSSPWTVAAE